MRSRAGIDARATATSIAAHTCLLAHAADEVADAASHLQRVHQSRLLGPRRHPRRYTCWGDGDHV